MKTRALALATALAVAAAAPAATIPSPSELLGMKVGADRTVTNREEK